jgi:hypothetical protein
MPVGPHVFSASSFSSFLLRSWAGYYRTGHKGVGTGSENRPLVGSHAGARKIASPLSRG